MNRNVSVRFARALSTRAEVLHSAPVVSWAGARQLNLGSVSSQLSVQTLAGIGAKLQTYAKNSSVGLVAFSSSNADFYAQQLPQNAETFGAVKSFVEELSAFPKPTIAAFEGAVSSSALGAFVHSRFRVGNESTKLVLNDFSQGRLPLGGGISSVLVGDKRDGVAYARYLVASQQELDVFDLHRLGFITHVVPDDVLNIVLPMVADISSIESTKAYQPRTDVVDSIGELLDTMHINTDRIGNVFLHPVWSKAVLVPPAETLQQEHDDESPDIDEIRELVVHCFSPDDPSESMKRLELLSQDASHKYQSWAADTLAVLQKNDKDLMSTWYKITKHVARKPLSNVLALEEQLIASMQQSN